MQLPSELLDAIETEVANSETDLRSLEHASAQLSEDYRSGTAAPALKTDAQRGAYLIARFPATYSATWRVFSEISKRASQEAIKSFLDLGSGPGTALFAAADLFPSLEKATLLDKDAKWLQLGRRLGAQSSRSAVREASWLHHDLNSPPASPPHDLVTISYALGELSAAKAEAIVRHAWDLSGKFLAIIEPGTRRGFANINAARSTLLAAGANILAPCPHHHACPMAKAGDWCHFAQRVQRTAAHRRLKSGSLGYEDEKFSYVVASRFAIAAAKARIMRHPRKHPGHVQLTLCCESGELGCETVARSQKTQYREARRAEWGDSWSG